ncbi:PREDICTED: M-phase phosphoprotein 9 isoform X2 [Miniopterus natalensis]|nr:PREDICTED: M-phase phosphoprotein 9 isoform X2 [Miniopterus natalensis]
MQELPSRAGTDSQLWRSRQARWLQLFSLVETQCQEQIAAQQAQFHTQVQRIQEEIKNLVKLQSSNAARASCHTSSLSKHISPGRQMGFFSENSDRNESVLSYPKSKEPETQQDTAPSQPDCTMDSSSVSSGYGTFCVSELNTYTPKGPQDFREPAEASAGQCGVPAVQDSALVDRGKYKRFFFHSPEELGASLKEQIPVFPAEFEHSFLGESQISEVYSGKANSKAITSWAQKLKQNHPKGAHAEEGRPRLTHGGERPQRAPAEKSELEFAAATPPRAFYLSKPDESPSFWMPDSGAGLTYWKLEEKDLYHPLPEASLSSTRVSASQSNTSSEMRLPSLKDIYHKKQRETKQLPERDLAPACSLEHPPEVLTLDPTLHRRPGGPVSGAQPPGFLNVLQDRLSSPDSVPEPSVSAHSDIDSFSQASNVPSQLSGFPKCPSDAKASTGASWKSPVSPSGSRTSSTFPSVYTVTCNDTSVSTVEEGSVMVTAASFGQSQLPGTASGGPECVSLASLEDPGLLSNIRQNLKEKHARHIADLRAYYESEITSLKQKLEAKEMSAVEDWKKTNQILVDRCSQLDGALSEATSRLRTLENKNNLLEREVSDFRERLSATSSASKALQDRIEEMRASDKEKDGTLLRLKSRLQDVEEALEHTYRLSSDKDTRLKQEHKMFQDLLGEYESLGKEHERVKDTLNTTENRLLDAQTQISDLKRTISKLEAQVKQVEHENMLSLRHSSRAPARPSRANTLATSDVSRRKWLIPGAEYSIFTGQPLDGQDRTVDRDRREETCLPGFHPSEEESAPGSSPANFLVTKQRASDSPIVRALKELEGEKVFKHWGTQTEKEDTSNKLANPQQPEVPVGASRSPEKCAQQRPRRFSSTAQRSSSLPPSNRKSGTPTKREIMLTPVAVAYSPKRSPKENLSPGFSHLLSKTESSPIRFDILLDDLDSVPVSTSQRTNPRKQLQFLPLGDSEEKKYSEKATDTHANSSSPPELLPSGMKAPGRPAWAKGEPGSCEQCQSTPAPRAQDFEYTAKIRTLAETERFFDELTKEKDQIEAALSRMPSAGGRVTLQTRLNQEALEDRLERVNRELGSVRMTLKKFHVLRTSANL